MRSSKGLAVLLVLAGGLLAVLAGSRTWLTVMPAQAGAGLTSVAISGRQAAPVGVALGLAALAGAVALATAGRLVRYAVVALLVGCGLGVVATGSWLGVDEQAVVAAALTRATGATGGSLDGGPAGSAMRSGWPAVCAAGGALVTAGAVLALARARRWDPPSRRFDPPGADMAGRSDGPSAERDRAFDAWDALSAGGDPTQD